MCSEFWEAGYQFARTPMVYIGDNLNIFAVGSDQDLGPRNANNWVFLAETAPNDFVEGHCGDPALEVETLVQTFTSATSTDRR